MKALVYEAHTATIKALHVYAFYGKDAFTTMEIPFTDTRNGSIILGGFILNATQTAYRNLVTGIQFLHYCINTNKTEKFLPLKHD